MISSFGFVVAASAVHDAVLYVIYVFSAILMAIPIVMAAAMLRSELRHTDPRRRTTVYVLTGVLGLTSAGALAIVLTQ